MSKPVHVGENLHKAVKIVSSQREVPMKEIVEDLLRGEADDSLTEEIVEVEESLNQGQSALK